MNYSYCSKNSIFELLVTSKTSVKFLCANNQGILHGVSNFDADLQMELAVSVSVQT